MTASWPRCGARSRRRGRGRALHELRRLAPVWWVVRAYVLVAALVLAAGGAWSLSHPSIPHVVDGRGGAAALIARDRSSRSRSGCAGAGSTEGRRALAAANVVLLAAAVPVLQHVRHGAPVTARRSSSSCRSRSAASPSTARRCATSTRTRATVGLLHDVLLYDAERQPAERRRPERATTRTGACSSRPAGCGSTTRSRSATTTRGRSGCGTRTPVRRCARRGC